jgi:hypothetical protein
MLEPFLDSPFADAGEIEGKGGVYNPPLHKFRVIPNFYRKQKT